MTWLVLGVALWAGVHFIPSVGRGLRGRLIAGIGESGYKIGFALTVVASIALMVIGWRATVPVDLYLPPDWTKPVSTLLMLAALFLFVAARHKSRLKRIVRHPQLASIIVWAVAHLLANGDSRSVILFGGLGLWALAEIPLINRREGAWAKPEAPSSGIELRGLAIGVAVFAVILYLHPYFTGVSLIPA